jgi:hypothetical protein
MAKHWESTLFMVLLAFALLSYGIAQTKTKVSMADARTAALAAENGKIKSEELEKEKGKQIYSFDIQMQDGLHEVNIDAATGKVIEDSIENAQDEAKEAAEDKAAKAKKKTTKKPAAAEAHPQ